MQNSEYSRKNRYSAAMSIYVDGSSARKIQEVPERKNLTKTGKTEKKLSRAAAEKQRKQLRANRAIRVLTIAPLVTIALMLILVTLRGTIKNNDLMNQISDLESQYTELQAQNDSKEYDINRAVDLNTVIKVATEELGMVRSSAGQIITYKTSDSEYIQQMAEVPGN